MSRSTRILACPPGPAQQRVELRAALHRRTISDHLAELLVGDCVRLFVLGGEQRLPSDAGIEVVEDLEVKVQSAFAVNAANQLGEQADRGLQRRGIARQAVPQLPTPGMEPGRELRVGAGVGRCRSGEFARLGAGDAPGGEIPPPSLDRLSRGFLTVAARALLGLTSACLFSDDWGDASFRRT